MVCEVDDIKVYRGSDISIGNGIVVKQHTIKSSSVHSYSYPAFFALLYYFR